MSTEVENLATGTSIIPSEVYEELPPLIRDKLMEIIQSEPMIDFSVNLDSLFKSIQARLDPSKGIRMRRLFETTAIKRSETTLEFYNQPLQLFDRRRLWGKDITSYLKINNKETRDLNGKKLVKINVRKFNVDPFKANKKCKSVLMPELKDEVFHLHCGETWKYTPPPSQASTLNCSLEDSDDDTDYNWYSGKATDDEARVLGMYESPPSSGFMISTNEILPVAPVPSPSDSKQLLNRNLREFANASKALNEVSKLLNLYFTEESRHEERHRYVATLVADKIPKELNDSLFKEGEEAIDESNSHGDRPSQDAFTSNENKNECQAVQGIENDLEVRGESKTKTRRSITPGFAIDLLEVNYRRPNAVRRRVKASTSIAHWIENNILSEFRRSRSLTSLKGKTHKEFHDYASYESPKTPYSTLRDYHLFNKNASAIKSPFVYRGMDDELKATNSIDDFIKQQKRDSKVFHVYEALCKKKFPVPVKHSDSEKEESNKIIDPQIHSEECQDEGLGTDAWASRDKYLDHWWNSNGKYVIISQESEDPGYFGSADDDSQTTQKLQYQTDCEDSLDGVNDASLDYLSHTANFDTDEKTSTARILECLEDEDNTQFDIVCNAIYSKCQRGSSAEADFEDSSYLSPSANSPASEDCMLQWIRPVSSINHSSVEQENFWCGYGSLASYDGSVEYIWNLNSSPSALSLIPNESILQPIKPPQEAYQCPCPENGKRKLLRYLGKVYTFCSSKLKQKQ